MKKLLVISLIILAPVIASAGFFDSFAPFFGAGGPINTLDQIMSSTSASVYSGAVPFITQRTFGKPLFLSGLTTGKCVEVASNGLATTSAAACGTGSGGGSSGGTWSTTTSTVAGQLINYPNNATDIVTIGSTATTTAEFWFDPNTNRSFLTGNVGIGTTNPLAKLQINTETDNGNNVIDSSKFLIGGNTDAGNTAGLQISYNQSTRTAILNTVVPNVAYGVLSLQPYGGTVKVAQLGINTAAGASSRLQVVTGNDDGTSGENTNYMTVGGDIGTSGKLRLSYSTTYNAGIITAVRPGLFWDNILLQPYGTGNVGIGTTSPYAKLSVEGSSALGNSALAGYFIATSSTASTFAGSVGIGTTTTDSGTELNIHDQTGTATLDITGLAAQLRVAQGINVGTGFISIGFASPRIGLFRGAPGATTGLNYYSTATGDNTMNVTFGGASALFKIEEVEYARLSGATATKGNFGIGTTSPYAKLSVVGEVVAPYYTATTSTASTFPYASTTAISVSGLTSGNCVQAGTGGLLTTTSGACGSGGGSSGGTWSTTTSTVSGQLINYPNNTTDIPCIGSTATTSCEFWFNPNTNFAQLGATASSTKFIAGLGSNSAPSYSFTNDSDTGFFSSGNNNVIINSNGAQVIGVSSNSVEFDQKIVGNSNGGPNIINTAGTVSAPVYSFLGDLNTGFWWPFADTLSLTAGGVETMRSDSASTTFPVGNVGVGTTSPYSKLSVAGQVVGQNYIATSTTANVFGGSLTLGTNGLGLGTSYSSAVSAINNDLYLDAPTGRRLFFTLNGTGTYLGNWNANGMSINNGSNLNGTGVGLIVGSGNVGIGTTSPYAPLSILGQTVSSYFTATTSTASTFPYASTTALSGTTLCLSTDCRTAWPSSGSGVWPFVTTDSNYGVAVQSTTTPEWFKNGMMASSTSYFVNATTTNLTVTGSQWNPTLTSALVQTGSDGLMAEYAGTSCTNQFIRSLSALGIATCATVGAADVSLANLTATDSTLTFSGTYNGSTARTIGLNLGNANSWTALQQFNAQASSTLFSAATGFFNNILATSTTATSTFSGGVDLRTATVQQHVYPAFTYATSTSWTGTTTIALGPAYTIETWNAVKCFTDVGTLNVSFYDGTNRMNLVAVTTTVGAVTLSTNNTFTASEKRYVDIGTPATAPKVISCTVDKSINI